MATISKVKIANMALSHVGASSTIETFTEETSTAGIVDLWYDFSRLQVLEAADWPFARKRQALATHADDAPILEWQFRYQYPADCVSLRRLVNPLGPTADAVPMEIELSNDDQTKTILTNLESACVVYTKDLETTALFSPFFIEALSYLLAHHIAFPITGKQSLTNRMLEVYNGYIQQAPSIALNEEVSRPKRDAPWIRNRDAGTLTVRGNTEFQAWPDANN
jgi:hypothetical protein